MKKIIIILAALATMISCGKKPAHMLSGNLLTNGTDTLLMAYSMMGASGEVGLDTVVLKNGKFVYDLPVEGEMGLVMVIEQNRFIDNLTLYLLPGENCVINGTTVDYTLSGSRFYTEWNQYVQMTKDLDKQYNDLIHSLPETDDEDYDMSEFEAKRRAITRAKEEFSLEFIKANPDSDFSAFLASELTSADNFAIADAALTDRAKDGVMYEKYENNKLSFEANALRYASEKNIYEGAIAPDFSLKTSTGSTFTLSEKRGSWVLLDFWGTWCHWCVEGLPTLKEVAHTYADCLTVVSVDTNDPESAWLKGIEKYEMDWVQVYNSKADAIDSIYAVQGFPGFYLINPEGEIVMMAFGEPAHFVEKVGELMNRK